MAAVRTSRLERKARTRADLVAAARAVFLRQGFHGATLDAIAEEAGYTKGAVYSNFEDKDALFLAVLDAHYEQRVDTYARIMLEGDDLEETWREVSRFMVAMDTDEPRWLPVLSEFNAHAARDEELRVAYVRTRERFLEAVARVIDSMQSRFDITLRVSPLEAARASSVLIRGFSAERRLEPDAASPELFIEVHTAFLRGLTQTAEGSTV
jgi:AcrR family transcriptional regulator